MGNYYDGKLFFGLKEDIPKDAIQMGQRRIKFQPNLSTKYI